MVADKKVLKEMCEYGLDYVQAYRRVRDREAISRKFALTKYQTHCREKL